MKARPGFSLTEILTATTILSVLFMIMFGILQQTSRGWQAANRKVEASQVARMALEQIASDLEFSVAFATNVPLPTTNQPVAIAMIHQDNATAVVGTNVVASPPNDQIFVITPDAASATAGTPDLAETGYFPVRATRTDATLKSGRYYLIRHRILSDDSGYDFLSNSTNWNNTPSVLGNTSKRQVFVDNCLRFDVQFLYTDASGQTVTTNSWGRPQVNGTGAAATVTWQGNPATIESLPRTAEITISVLDDRAAERLARIAPDGLSPEDLGKLGNEPDTLEDISRADVKAVLREGLATFRRRVTFRNGQP